MPEKNTLEKLYEINNLSVQQKMFSYVSRYTSCNAEQHSGWDKLKEKWIATAS